jgi:S1-C subfamily serine protease
LRSLRRTILASSATLVAVALLGAPAGAAGQKTGVVLIETALGYQQASAAGTGVVTSPDGTVLTNNHVIRGATKIRVLVPSTRRRYAVRVLGYSLTTDIAVLKLQGAGGLATATLGRSASVRRGQPVAAVGNAEGAGTLVVSRGTVTAIGRTITVRDGQGGAQRLSGLIQINAELHPGESGGPLLDAGGRVIGIDTAASVGFAFRSGSNEGYAIPIDRALAIARQIKAGRESATVHVGPTAFLGVAVHSSGFYREGYVPGVRVDNLVSGGPAERAGLEQGDVITTIDGTRVATPADVARVVVRRHPGDTVVLTWVDDSGKRSSGRARLVTGPPQ